MLTTEYLIIGSGAAGMSFVDQLLTETNKNIVSRKPSLGVYPEWGRAGLLMSYSSDVVDSVRHAGTYVAKILSGTKPGDLPIEQASRFTLVINLKTAKRLGISVPPTLLALANEVIE
jgi:putative tryptophan/tyrosine transport system substrate-binding protein